MGGVLRAYARALGAQFSGRMLLLSALPFLLAGGLWAGLLYVGLQPLIDTLQAFFQSHHGYDVSNSMLGAVGLGMLKVVIVPLIAMLLLLPLMIATSLIFMGVAAMPAIARHVSTRQFPTLDKKEGGSFMGSLAANLSGVLIFLGLWIVTLPLYAFAPLALLAQVVLWGWLTARVMSYDALAAHASAEERAEVRHARRWPLLWIGMISGVAGALPGVAWIGGTVMSVLLFPFLAALSLWLYVMIFIFTGLWYQYYCLQALAELRLAAAGDGPAIDATAI